MTDAYYPHHLQHDFDFTASASWMVLHQTSTVQLIQQIMEQMMDSQFRLAGLTDDIQQIQQLLQQQLRARQSGQPETDQAAWLLHEVKNTLTGILSYAQLLEQNQLNPEEIREFVALLTTETERLLQLIQQTGTLSQIPLSNRRRLPVDQFLEELTPLLRSHLAGRRITFITMIQTVAPLWIEVDNIKQMFLNLACNAREAMPAGGTFSLSVSVRGEMVQFVCRDTGCGMPADLQAQFLQPAVTAGTSYGTGMGMTIVQQIVHAHQGWMEIESEPAVGTTIKIYLPIAPDESSV